MLLLVYNSISDTCLCLSDTPYKILRMTKNIDIMIVDSDSGEILYQPKESVCTSFKIHVGSFTGEDVCKRSFDSFLRGVLSGRNLHLSITITDFEPVKELSIF